MLEYIKVKNFRSIDNLEVESLRKVNIFVGENNCGKTTLLEAIYLNLNSLNPSSLMEIYINIRRLKLITTHSNEVLKALNDIYTEQAKDNTAIFKISRTKNLGLQSYQYDIETLSHIIKTETEIRG